MGRARASEVFRIHGNFVRSRRFNARNDNFENDDFLRERMEQPVRLVILVDLSSSKIVENFAVMVKAL